MRLESSAGFRFIVRPGSGLTVSKSWSCHYLTLICLYYNGKPAVVRQKEIDAIQDFLDQASEHALCPGEEVEILCGAMKHVSGKVKKIKKNHLVLYLEQLGATVCVKLDDVARVDRLK